MFYSDTVLAKKGPLARVWLAAHWERKLSKHQFLQANIASSVAAIVEGAPLALRLSGQLLLGVVRIFSRKTRYLLEDLGDATVKIKMAFRPGQVDMPPEHLLGMLPDTLSEFELLLPDAVFAPRVQKASNDITLPDSFYPQYSQTANNLAENSQLLSNSNLLDNSIDDSIIQVGRDQEMARGVGEGDLQFGQGAIDFGFEKLDFQEDSVAFEPMVADVSQLMLAPAAEEHSMPHFDQQEPSMMPEFPEINMMSEFPEISMRQDENFGILEATPRAQSPGKQQYVLQSPIQTTPTKKTRRVAQKKRKVVDTEIELDSELQRRQLADTSDIQQPIDFIAFSRGRALHQNTCGSFRVGHSLPAALAHLVHEKFTNHRAPHIVPEPMIEPEQPEVASMEEMSQIFVNPHELLDVDPIPMPQDIDEQAFPLLEEQPHEQDINDSIAYTASMQLENNPLDDSAFLTAPAQLDPIDESILEVEAAENTILRQKLESNTETKFSSLKAVSKSQAARYFFDALLLKTNDLIKVKQEYPYGEIIIQAKVAVTNSGRTVCNLTLTDECHDNLMSLIQIN